LEPARVLVGKRTLFLSRARANKWESSQEPYSGLCGAGGGQRSVRAGQLLRKVIAEKPWDFLVEKGQVQCRGRVEQTL
jgi:hypothetical protein